MHNLSTPAFNLELRNAADMQRNTLPLQDQATESLLRSLVDEKTASRTADKWMDWTTSSFAGAFRDVFWGILRTPAEQQDWVKINASIKTCAELLVIPDQALAEKPYLSGDEIGMGDIPLGSFIYAWFEMPIERSHDRIAVGGAQFEARIPGLQVRHWE